MDMWGGGGGQKGRKDAWLAGLRKLQDTLF